MAETKFNGKWGMKNSAYILLGLFPWLDAFAFVYMGRKTGRKQWTRMGIIFGVLWYFGVLFYGLTYSYLPASNVVRQVIFLVKAAILVLWPVIMILLLASRKDYLRLLAVTEKEPDIPELMQDKKWRMQHSMWTIWSFIPGLGGISLLTAGYSMKDKTWKKISAAVTAIGVLSIVGIRVANSYAYASLISTYLLSFSARMTLKNLSCCTLILLFSLQIALMLAIRKEYLIHEAVKWDTGKRKYKCLSSLNWRMKNSWWILMCLVPYCTGVGLIIAGLQSKKKKWAATGLIAEILIAAGEIILYMPRFRYGYSILKFNLSILNFLVILTVFSMAFVVRNEFLFIRAKMLGGNETAIQQEIAAQENFRKRTSREKTVETDESEKEKKTRTVELTPVKPEKKVEKKVEKQAEKQVVLVNASEKTDINTCTEAELRKLPGLSLAQIKAAVEYREKNGFFNSVDDFVSILGIKPHFAVQIFEMAVASPAPVKEKTESEKVVRRTIDI